MAKVLYECSSCRACGWHEDVGPIIENCCPGEDFHKYNFPTGFDSKRLTKEEAESKFDETTHPKVKDRAGK
jgi:hypothetical protein